MLKTGWYKLRPPGMLRNTNDYVASAATRATRIASVVAQFAFGNPFYRNQNSGDSRGNGRRRFNRRSPADQHDPWPAAGALDAGEQLHLPRPAAAAVVPHAAMMSRISMSPCAECVSENIHRWPHRSQVTRINHDGNARNGSSRASATGWQWLVAVAAPVTGAGSGERSFQGRRGQ
jgi:hypothetical protein